MWNCIPLVASWCAPNDFFHHAASGRQTFRHTKKYNNFLILQLAGSGCARRARGQMRESLGVHLIFLVCRFRVLLLYWLRGWKSCARERKRETERVTECPKYMRARLYIQTGILSRTAACNLQSAICFQGAWGQKNMLQRLLICKS